MTRIRTLFAEALRSIGANVSTTVASALSVLIGMFLIGVFIGLGTWLVSWSDEKKRELAVHVFIADQATTKQIDELRVLLESDQRVKPGGITFISKAKALEIMRKRNPELTQNLASNPLPSSFDVVPKRGEDTEAIAIAVQKSKLAAVDQVRYGKEVSQRILQIARAIQIVFLIAVVVLLAASTILIANTIRLSIFARRREIEVMKLVGATNWYVRGPFMLEGVLTGLAGSVAAVLLLFISREIAIPQILGHIQDDADVRALAFTQTAAILIMGGLMWLSRRASNMAGAATKFLRTFKLALLLEYGIDIGGSGHGGLVCHSGPRIRDKRFSRDYRPRFYCMWVGCLPWWLFFAVIFLRDGFPSWTFVAFVVRVFEPLTTKDTKGHEGRQAGTERTVKTGWEIFKTQSKRL
jgi:cell division transport system permease protein